MEFGSSETAMYAYNKDGLRIRKESSSRGITRYVLSGKQIIHMTREKAGALEAEMHFYYNERSKPTVCAYNGKRYGYVYNAHGDVMALIDLENGRHQVVTYTYDAWGKQIGCTGDLAGTLGKENPFRYRTYVYDEETGLYYLRSRYYNPEWGRFINADKLLTQNLFAYCENMPVKMVDADGMSQVHATHSADGGGVAKKTASSGGSGSSTIANTPSKTASSTANTLTYTPYDGDGFLFIIPYPEDGKPFERSERYYEDNVIRFEAIQPEGYDRNIRLRQYPDASSPIIGHFKPGEPVQVIGTTIDQNGEVWYWVNEKITYDPETGHETGRYSGFIHGDLILWNDTAYGV